MVCLSPDSRLSELDAPVDHETDAFLLMAAESLHRYGTPSYRLERVMTKVAASLDVSSVFLYTPTALVVSLGSGADERTYVRRVDSGDVDIDRLLAVDETLERLESGAITVARASAELEAVADRPPVFGLINTMAAAAAACGGIAVIFGGSIVDASIAAVLGLIICLATTVFQRRGQQGLLEPTLGFCVAMLAVLLSRWLPVNDRLITLAALILPIPGLAMTIALTELAVMHWSSGSARLAGALVKLLTLIVGVAIAWRLSESWRLGGPAGIAPLPEWALWIAVGLTPLAFAVVFRAPLSQWPAIVTVVVSGFLASTVVGAMAGAEMGAFFGALVVGCGSNLYARLRNRPAMILQTPGLLILVPGSIGYRSLTAMIEHDTLRGVELAFSMSITAVALVGGLLLANQLISPKRIL